MGNLQETVLSSPRNEWRSAEYYFPLLEYDCAKWAGEWLRRNPKFQAELSQVPCLSETEKIHTDGGVNIVACSSSCPLTPWGLRCCRTIGDKPVFFWLPQYNPYVLTVDAETATDAEGAVDLRQCPLLKAVVHDAKREAYLLFNDGARTLEIIGHGCVAFDAPVSLRCTLHGMQDFENKALSLRRLCSLYQRGLLVKSLYPGERRAHRWIEMLRAWDGSQEGASHREIAAEIFGDDMVQDSWDDTYRYRVRRLLQSAKKMIEGDYLVLLQRAEMKRPKPRFNRASGPSLHL